MVDRADIRPLDVSGALQILLTEIRTAFNLPLEVAGAPISLGPVQATQHLVGMFLQALPDDTSDAPAWAAVFLRVDTALQTGMDRAIEAVTAWRDVSPAVVDAVRETRTLVFSALGDEPQNPLWLRPEWVGLAPRIQRFWRRRRNVRRRLTDPDYPPGSLDEGESGL
jgi:hypothetical protein